MRLCGHWHRADLLGTDLSWRLVAVPLEDPALVVGPLERDECQAEFLDCTGAQRQLARLAQLWLKSRTRHLPHSIAGGLEYSDHSRRSLQLGGLHVHPHSRQPPYGCCHRGLATCRAAPKRRPESSTGFSPTPVCCSEVQRAKETLILPSFRQHGRNSDARGRACG